MNSAALRNATGLMNLIEEVDDMTITETQARNFWADLQGTLFPDNPDFEGKHNHGWILSTETIAERMQMDPETTEMFLRRCLANDVNLSDRASGCWVV